MVYNFTKYTYLRKPESLMMRDGLYLIKNKNLCNFLFCRYNLKGQSLRNAPLDTKLQDKAI